jgi:hypothetical protein
MRFQLGELFFLSRLEKGRTANPSADPKAVASFETLNEVIAHSLKVPSLLRTQTKEGTLLKSPELTSRPFKDENLLKKLVQFRDQIPLSHRVIRTPRT